jgi:GNAT superfamily N-acetyltransferase
MPATVLTGGRDFAYDAANERGGAMARFDDRTVDRCVAAFTELWDRMARLCPAGDVAEQDGVLRLQTGLPVPPFNGVFGIGREVSVGAVLDAVDDFAARGLPWNVQLRPDYPRELDGALADRGLAVAGEIPFMLLDTTDALPPVDDSSLRRAVTYADVGSLLGLLEQGFEMPAEFTRQAFPMGALFVPGAEPWLLAAGGQDVSTALGHLSGGACGIFNVATPPALRGRGHGAAATAAAIRSAFAAGADVAFLQSSPLGRPVYERLGFVPVELWTQWMPREYLEGEH